VEPHESASIFPRVLPFDRRRRIECKVVTRSPREKDKNFPFELIDNPGRSQIRALVRWSDVVLFNGASLALQPWVILYRKPFVWVHVGYQAATIDGAGWFDNVRTPLTPWASFLHHLRRDAKTGLRDGLKLLIRRAVATRFVTRNVAITQWMAKALPLPRQVQIYNPFPADRFASAGSVDSAEYEFMFLGRLVSEKGVDILLRAFAKVVTQNAGTPRLLIIGDGDRKSEILQLAERLGVASSITFAGQQRGAELIEWVSKGQIAVLPSIWYEPMGGVVVELMASGRNLIVSEHGGLSECMGDAGLSFPNGNVDALASCMDRMLGDPGLRATQALKARERATAFASDPFIDQYVALLQDLARPRG
jgi:glycosyltransferase involved in cell wall biosynthesis